MQLAKGPYASLNHTRLTEMLAEREDVHLSRSTVRGFCWPGVSEVSAAGASSTWSG